VRERTIARIGRLYAGLVRLYSPRFRREYGADMTRVFVERLVRARDSRGRAGALACLARALGDVAVNAPLDRLAARRRPVPADALPEGDGVMTRFALHLRFARRALRRQPAFAAAVTATLALGTGATIAVFAIADAALVHPLPYPQAERLVSVLTNTERFGLLPFAPPYLADLKERTTRFDTLVGFSSTWALTLTGLGEPRIVPAAYLSDGALDVFGARIVEGRAFLPHEHVRGGPPVVLVSRGFFARQFGPDARLQGQTLRLDGMPRVIVGIVDELRLPITSSLVSQHDTLSDIWLPFAANPYVDLRSVPVMNVVGRLKPGVPVGEADAEIHTVGRALAEDDQQDWTGVTAVPLGDVVTRGSRRTVLTMFGAAAFLLLIACANVANLQLARAAARRHEIAVRASLGASRRQVIAGLLVESGLLATAGCAAGLALAWWALAAVPALGLRGLPPSAVIVVGWRAAGFSALLAAVTTMAFGLSPALGATRDAPGALLRDGLRTTGRPGRLRGSLAAAEVALALALLAGAGLLARSFWRLTHVDPGFDVAGLAGAPVGIDSTRFPDGAERQAFLDQVLERIAGLSAVTRVAAVNRSPLSGSNVLVGVELADRPETATAPITMDRRVVTPGYFATMRVPLQAGRDFGAVDAPDSNLRAAIVNEAVARRYWSDGDALGRRLRLMLRSGPGPWLTVVGVVGDLRYHGLDQPVADEIYVPYSQAPVESMVVLARAAGDARAAVTAIKAQIWAIDRDLPLDGAGPMADAVDASVAGPRFRMLLLNGFAALALLLAAIGVYGVIAYSVSQRTRDIGVRLALGAQGRDVVRMIVLEGLRFAAWGVAAGLATAVVLGRLLSGLLFGVEPTDPVTFAAVTALLVATVVVACYVPARRATRVDPIEVLRAE